MVGAKNPKLSIVEKLLFLYIVLIPVMFTPLLSVYGKSIQYSDLVFIPALAVWFIAIFRKKYVFRFTGFDFFLIALCILFFVSLLISSNNKTKSSFEYLGILYLFCVYFIFKESVRNMYTWWRILKFWVIVSFIISLVGLGSYLVGGTEASGNIFVKKYDFVSFLGPRICSTFANPNMLASYLHVTIIFALILLGRAQELKKETLWFYVLTIFFLIICFLTKTRIIAGVVLSISIVLFMSQKTKLFLMLRCFVAVIFILGLFLSFVSVIWWVFPIETKIDNGSLNIKVNLVHFPYYMYNQAAAAMIIDNPLFGVGMGMYNADFMRYISIKEAESSFHVGYPDYEIGKDPLSLLMKGNGPDPHSTYLGWAAETGLFGLFAIFAMFFYYCMNLIRNFKRNTNSFDKYVMWCFFAGMCGFLLNGFYIDILTMRHFWVFMAMGTAFSLAQQKGREENGLINSYTSI